MYNVNSTHPPRSILDINSHSHSYHYSPRPWPAPFCTSGHDRHHPCDFDLIDLGKLALGHAISVKHDPAVWKSLVYVFELSRSSNMLHMSSIISRWGSWTRAIATFWDGIHLEIGQEWYSLKSQCTADGWWQRARWSTGDGGLWFGRSGAVVVRTNPCEARCWGWDLNVGGGYGEPSDEPEATMLSVWDCKRVDHG
jgi:hypothetical protein